MVPWQRPGLVSRGGFRQGHFIVVTHREVGVVEAGEQVVIVTLLLVHVALHEGRERGILTLINPKHSIFHMNDAVHDFFCGDKSQHILSFTVFSFTFTSDSENTNVNQIKQDEVF